MVEGYAKVIGKPGIVLVTSGPGATNVITVMQSAVSDSVPLAGQVLSLDPPSYSDKVWQSRGKSSTLLASLFY